MYAEYKSCINVIYQPKVINITYQPKVIKLASLEIGTLMYGYATD